jgi:hypothetical protein
VEDFERLRHTARRQKKQLLSDNGGGYFTAANTVMREVLPQLVREGRARGEKNAKDAILLYCYLLSYVNNVDGSPRQYTAFPSRERIANDTGIGVNRIKNLAEDLTRVGLLGTKRINGRDKLYIPLYITKGAAYEEE